MLFNGCFRRPFVAVLSFSKLKWLYKLFVSCYFTGANVYQQIQQQNEEYLAQLDKPVAELNDSGKYTVTASNPFGKHTLEITVDVLGTLQFELAKIKF